MQLSRAIEGLMRQMAANGRSACTRAAHLRNLQVVDVNYQPFFPLTSPPPLLCGTVG